MRLSCVRAGGALLLAVLAGCGGTKATTPDAGVVSSIGPEGGIIKADGIQISIPQGALRDAVQFHLVSGDYGAPDVPDRVRISRVYILEPDTVSLDVPATVVIGYQPELIPDGVPATSADVRRTDFTLAQERLNAVSVNTAAQTVSGETTSFGTFWATAPAGPRPSVITLTPPASLIYQGTSTQLNAEVRDQNGRLMPGQKLLWSSSDTTVATVDGKGTVTGVAPGVVEVLAKAGAAQGKASVQVAGTDPYPESFQWENPLPEGNPLYAVGGDPASLVIGGRNGMLLRRDESGWQALYSAQGATFNAVAAGAAGVVAAGARDADGVLALWNGTQTRETRVPDTVLAAAWVGADKAIAVGDGPNLAVLDAAGSWSVEPSPVTEPLLAVDGSAGPYVVVGARGAVYKRAGSAWVALSMQPLPQLQIAAAVRGVEAWAISQTALRHFAEGTWSTQALQLPPKVTITFEVMGLAGPTPVVAGRDASGQVYLLLPTDGGTDVHTLGTDRVTAVWGRSSADLYAVTVSGSIRHYDGTAWTDLRQGTTTDIAAVAAFEGPRVFAAFNQCVDSTCASKQGVILDRDAQTGTFHALGDPLPKDVAALAGRSASDVWAVSSAGYAYHYDGTTWTPSTVSVGTPLWSVATCPGNAWAGATSKIFRESNGTWTLVQNFGSPRFRGIACAGDGVFAVGDYALVSIAKNGSTTTISTSDYSIQGAPWRAVWANASGQAFIGGDARYILWWDGTTLVAYDQPANLPVKSVRALWGTSFGSLWAGGVLVDGTGFLLHFNGASWTAVDPGTSLTITALSGLPSGELWVGGAGGALLHGPLAPPPAPPGP